MSEISWNKSPGVKIYERDEGVKNVQIIETLLITEDGFPLVFEDDVYIMLEYK